MEAILHRCLGLETMNGVDYKTTIFAKNTNPSPNLIVDLFGCSRR